MLATINIGGNTIDGAGGNGISVGDVNDPDTQLDIGGNDISNTGGNGINIENFNGSGIDINGNNIDNAGGHGIGIDGFDNPEGDLSVGDNNITNSGGDGINVNDFNGDSMNFSGNNITGSGGDGIHIENFNGTEFIFDGNTTSDNAGNGLSIIQFNGSAGNFDIVDHISNGNGLDGIVLKQVDGDILVENANSSNNIGNGLVFDSVTNPDGSKTIVVGGNFTDNNAGATSAILIILDEPFEVANVEISNSVFDANGLHITGIAIGEGTDLTLDITDSPSFTSSANDAVSVAAFSGGTVDLTLQNHVMADNNVTINGAIVRLTANDLGTGLLTTLTADISDNNFTNIGGNGVLANIIGNSVSDIDFANNTIQGATADSVSLTYAVTNDLINRARIFNNRLTGAADDGISIVAANTTRLDLLISLTTITNPGDRGIQVIASDSALVRGFIRGNLVTDANDTTRDGILVSTSGSSRFAGDIFGNIVTGFGADDNITVDVNNLPAILPAWFATGTNGHGIQVNAAGNSNIAISVSNNAAANSALDGIHIESSDNANIDAVVRDNNLVNNDRATVIDSSTNPATPIKLPFQQDMEVESNDNSTITVAIDNTFAMSALIVDENFGSTLNLEEGNNLPPLTIQGGVNVSTFDRNNSAAIDALMAELANFINNFGFPA